MVQLNFWCHLRTKIQAWHTQTSFWVHLFSHQLWGLLVSPSWFKLCLSLCSGASNLTGFPLQGGSAWADKQIYPELIELVEESARSQLNWQTGLSGAQPLAFQTTNPQVETPALSSVSEFHFGNCWQFSWQFPIFLESVPQNPQRIVGGSCSSLFCL